MTRAEEKEIKHVLLGRTIPMEKGVIRAMGEDDYRMPIGIGDGAGAVRFFGVARRSKLLETELSEKEVRYACKKSMRKVGRTLILLKQEETPACLIRYILSRPAVLTVTFEDGKPVATAFSGRGIMGWISLFRALSELKRELPQTIRYSDERAPKVKAESKRQQKKRLKKEMKAKAREEDEG